MRAGIRVATASALWGCGFLALAHTHLTPEKSIAPLIGAALWLLGCVALVRGRPRAQARRLVVTTTAVVVALLVASIMELGAENTLVPEVLAAVAFLATLQCFAATLAEIAFDLRVDRLETTWESTGRFLVVVDAASVVVAAAWAANLVERRQHGAFRVTDIDLAPAGAAGAVLLAVYAAILAVAAGSFVLSAWRTWSWAREPDDAKKTTVTD
jgi:hypothetical protein